MYKLLFPTLLASIALIVTAPRATAQGDQDDTTCGFDTSVTRATTLEVNERTLSLSSTSGGRSGRARVNCNDQSSLRINVEENPSNPFTLARRDLSLTLNTALSGATNTSRNTTWMTNLNPVEIPLEIGQTDITLDLTASFLNSRFSSVPAGIYAYKIDLMLSSP